MLPTQEYQNGQYVTVTAPFRVYHNVAESIADHGKLLATSPSYQHAMADRHLPDAFATDLTGVYATDPNYGSNLIAIMRLYNLYQFSAQAQQRRPRRHQPPRHRRSRREPRRYPPPRCRRQSGTDHRPGRRGDPGRHVRFGRHRQRGRVRRPGPGSSGRARWRGGDDSAACSTHTRRHRARAAAAVGSAGDAGSGGSSSADGAGAARAARAPGRPHQPPGGPGRAAPATAEPVRAADPAGRHDRVRRHGQGAAQPGRAAVRRRGRAAAASAGSCWPPATGCSARPGRATRRSTARSWARSTRTAPCTAPKSEALAQCASDLIELALAVYWIDITARRPLSVRDLAQVFAAFRWGGLLKLHGISAMEFPYSVAGLTEQHVKMRWPDIEDPNAPDKPGTRFRAAVRRGARRAEPRLPGHRLAPATRNREEGPMLRLLILLAEHAGHAPAAGRRRPRPAGTAATPSGGPERTTARGSCAMRPSGRRGRTRAAHAGRSGQRRAPRASRASSSGPRSWSWRA